MKAYSYKYKHISICFPVIHVYTVSYVIPKHIDSMSVVKQDKSFFEENFYILTEYLAHHT